MLASILGTSDNARLVNELVRMSQTRSAMVVLLSLLACSVTNPNVSDPGLTKLGH